MKRTRTALLIGLLSLGLSHLAFAQFTTVTGTVTDPNGVPYAFGTISPILVVPSGTGSPTLNGNAYTPPTQPTGLDKTGSFTLNLADNTVLLPASTKWNFTVCSAVGTVNPAIGTGSQCFTLAAALTISGASQSITTQLTAAALALTVPIGGAGGTVTHTLGPLALNTVVEGNGGADIQTLPNFLYNGTAGAMGPAATIGKIDPISCPAGNSFCTGSAIGQSLFDLAQSVTAAPPTDNLVANVVSGIQANPTANVGSASYFAGWFEAQSNSTNTHNMSQLNGLITEADHFGSGSLNNLTGLETGAFNHSSGPILNATGVLGSSQNQGTGIVTNAKAGQFLSGVVNAGGSTTNDYVLEVDSPAFTGVMTHHHGIHIFDQTVGGANNPDPWSIYNDGGKSYFRDQISLRAPTGEQIPVNAQTNVQGYGSSLTLGIGASVPATKGFFGLICAQNAFTCTNNGISGSGIADQITSINGVTQAPGIVNLVEVGINDARTGGTTGSYQDQYRAGLLYALVSAGLPDVNKYWADNANITYVNWAGSTTVFGRGFKFTNTVGATATAVMWGTAVYVGFLTQQTNNAVLSVAVDGVVYVPAFSMQGANASPLSSFNWPYAVRIGGLSSSTSHTVVVTYVSGTGNGGLSFIASTGGTTTTSFAAFSPTGPSTYVINAILCCTDINQDPYNQITKQIVSELSADGVNIQLVDVASAFNGNVPGEINGGSSNHPSDLGYQIIANAIQFAMTPQAVPFDRNKFQAPNWTCTNTTPVTVTANVATDQLLMTCTVPSNFMNFVGRTLHLWNAGVYSTTVANASTLELKVKLCTNLACSGGTVLTLLDLTSGANAGGQTNDGFNLEAWITTTSSGATSAFETHGNLAVNLAAGASTLYSDGNTAVSSGINTNGLLFLQVTGAFSIASATNSFTQRQMIAGTVSPF